MFDRNTSSTVCAKCEHVILPFKTAPWWRWLCAANKLEPRWNPVTGEHDKDEPYARAQHINGGDCKFYRPGPNSIRPRATPDGEVIEQSAQEQST